MSRVVTPSYVGMAIEKMAISLLESEGYRLIEWSSKKNWFSHYDLIVEKNGEQFFVEVRGRTEPSYFSFTKDKIERLRQLHGNVLILLLRPDGYKLFPLVEIENEKSIMITSKHPKSNYAIMNHKYPLIRMSDYVKRKLDILKESGGYTSYDSLLYDLLSKAGEA